MCHCRGRLQALPRTERVAIPLPCISFLHARQCIRVEEEEKQWRRRDSKAARVAARWLELTL